MERRIAVEKRAHLLEEVCPLQLLHGSDARSTTSGGRERLARKLVHVLEHRSCSTSRKRPARCQLGRPVAAAPARARARGRARVDRLAHAGDRRVAGRRGGSSRSRSDRPAAARGGSPAARARARTSGGWSPPRPHPPPRRRPGSPRPSPPRLRARARAGRRASAGPARPRRPARRARPPHASACRCRRRARRRARVLGNEPARRLLRPRRPSALVRVGMCAERQPSGNRRHPENVVSNAAGP